MKIEITNKPRLKAIDWVKKNLRHVRVLTDHVYNGIAIEVEDEDADVIQESLEDNGFTAEQDVDKTENESPFKITRRTR